MKIGILTYHSVCNFGANLQALSTVSYFKNNSIDVKVIDWCPKDLKQYYSRTVCEKQREYHKEFVKRYIPLTTHCENSEEVKKVIHKEHFDVIVIGSDAVFSFIPFLKRIHLSRKTGIGVLSVTSDHKIPNPFWGDFMEIKNKVKLVALSASAQYLDYNKCTLWEKRKIKRLICNFEQINVRDRWTKMVLSKFTNKCIKITPDPVFGFNVNVKEQIEEVTLRNKFGLSNKYILLSFCSFIYPGEWYKNLFNLLKDEGFQIINLAMPEGCLDIPCDKIIDVPLSPLDWYALIKHSDGYIGQRMHPMIVALNNIVPFYVFDHYAFKKGNSHLESSKIYDLLERADLLSQYCNIKDSKRFNLVPQDVVSAILTYDKNKVASFVKEYQRLYFDMMSSINK